MRCELAYGKTGLHIDLPDTARVTVVRPRHVDGAPDAMAAIRAALRNPIALPPLRELVKATDTVGIIFSDLTRPSPSHLLLPALREELSAVPDARILLFNATGTHRPNTEAELRAMLGDEMVDRHRIIQHDAEDQDALARVGVTRGGNAVWIRRDFLACDARILTGLIEPHLFAGFSGGGKAILPGIAGRETVLRNHCAANLDHPRARWGVTEGNPVFDEIREAAEMVRPTFLLNVTLNGAKQVTRVFAGDPAVAHARGCAFVKESAMVPVDAPFDIVIGTNAGYPLDLNLYQSVKGMSAAAQIVREGGDIIIAADCWDGIPEHGAYGRLLREAESLEQLLATIRAPGALRQDAWQAHAQALVLQWAKVHLFSRNLTPEQIRGALLTPCRDIEATVAALRRQYDGEATIAVMPEGPHVAPYVRGRA